MRGKYKKRGRGGEGGVGRETFLIGSRESRNLIGSKRLLALKEPASLHKSIQIQMQPLTHPQSRPNHSPLALQPSLHEQAQSYQCDQHSQMILEMLAQGRPVFVVEEWSEQARKAHLQREMIKRKILSYNRKEKSLEELSRKFIQNFEQGREVLLELDKVTLQLKVERRRIYDIVNIFESLQVVRKAAKNNYLWRGLKEAVRTIHELPHAPLPAYHPANQKSLENLATRFLNLFVTHTEPITLQEAAKLLLHNQDSALAKTKIRRLYDIVNVFKSVGLVEKVHTPSKKAGFRWVGTGYLEKIIEDKKRECREGRDEHASAEVEKENRRELPNAQHLHNPYNVNEWFSDEERKAISAMGFMKEFNQKLFLPSIILREGSGKSLPQLKVSQSDISSQY